MLSIQDWHCFYRIFSIFKYAHCTLLILIPLYHQKASNKHTNEQVECIHGIKHKFWIQNEIEFMPYLVLASKKSEIHSIILQKNVMWTFLIVKIRTCVSMLLLLFQHHFWIQQISIISFSLLMHNIICYSIEFQNKILCIWLMARFKWPGLSTESIMIHVLSAST